MAKSERGNEREKKKEKKQQGKRATEKHLRNNNAITSQLLEG